jgi:hypothetical protein
MAALSLLSIDIDSKMLGGQQPSLTVTTGRTLLRKRDCHLHDPAAA